MNLQHTEPSQLFLSITAFCLPQYLGASVANPSELHSNMSFFNQLILNGYG